jgi:uncharacterized protein
MSAALKKGGVTVVSSVEVLTSFPARAKGLLGRNSLPAGQAVCLLPCNGIHTFFMRFALDVIFLDLDMRVARIARDVRPNRLVTGVRNGWCVLELQSGWLPEAALGVGDVLELAEDGGDV